jgi:hypothetical protein
VVFGAGEKSGPAGNTVPVVVGPRELRLLGDLDRVVVAEEDRARRRLRRLRGMRWPMPPRSTPRRFSTAWKSSA